MNLFKRKNNIGIQYSFLFVIVLAFFGIQFAYLGKTMIWSVDGYLQWYPLFAKFKMLMGDLFTHGFALWQWDTGLGGDTIANYSFMLFDPFHYIALLFSKANQDVAYTIVVVLKLYAAGFIVLKYLQYKGKSINLCLIGAISYAFCSWAIVCIRHDFFITQLVLFPLIIWGIDLVWKKKNPALLIVSIFFSCAISVYFTYMTAGIVVVYVIVKYFVESEAKSVKDFIGRMLFLLKYAVLGALIAIPIVASQLYALINTSTESGEGLTIFPALTKVLLFVPGLAGNIDINENYSNIALNAILIIAVAVVLIYRKKTTAMWMSIILGIFLLIPLFQSVLNGLSYPSGRWCYTVAFFFTLVSVESLEIVKDNISKYKTPIFIFAGLSGVIAIVLKVLNHIQTAEFVYVVIDILFVVAILCLLIKKQGDEKNESRIKMLVVANVAVICFVFFIPYVGNGVSIYSNQKVCFNSYQSSSLSHASKIKDNDFYRVGTFWNPGVYENGPVNNAAINSNIFWNVPSTFEYLSTLDSDWIEYNKELSNSGGNYLRMTSLHNDSRSRINFLQNVKYYISKNLDYRARNIRNDSLGYDLYSGVGYKQIKVPNTKTHIFKNDIDTSLGYVFDKVVSKSDYLKYDSVKREQILMNSLVVEDKDMKEFTDIKNNEVDKAFEKTTQIPYDLKTDSKAVKIKNNKIIIKKPSKHVILKPKAAANNQELYLVIKGYRRKNIFGTDIKDNDKNYISRNIGGEHLLKGFSNAERVNQGLQGVKDYIVNLGLDKNPSGNIAITFKNPGEYSYDSMELVTVSNDKFFDEAQKLSDQRLKTKTVKNDLVEGTVNAKKDGMLYLSIIKNDGWKVYIDGKKADKLYQVDTAFTGVKIKKGQHTIKLVYSTIGMPYTLLASAFGIIILVVIEILYFKRKKKDRSLR